MTGAKPAGDLGQWLAKLGLGGYGAAFAASGIDWDVLADLCEQDLKELGLSLGDRKRLLKAVGAIKVRSPDMEQVAVPEVSERPSPLLTAVNEAERRYITVMFVDLVGSTPLSKRFDPEEMRDVLHAFRQASAEVVEAHDGHIANYMGDGILIYFGYPRAHEDDAARAVRAGLGIIEALRATNDRLDAKHGVRLQVRIGVHTGLVVAGEMGAGSVRDSQAIVGETPNVAARLQSLAQPDTLLIGPATQRLVEGLFLLEELGPRELKGLSGSVPIYRVLSEAINPFDVRALKGLTPLVGRAAEVEMLRQRWAQGCDGEMRCVLLIGEPGIGKSRTLRAFRDSLADEQHERITFHCSPYHQNSAFWPVLEWLRRALRLDPKNYTDDDVEKVEGELDSLALDVREFTPIFIAFLGLPTAGRHEAIDPASASFKHRSVDALVRVVGAMTRRMPVLLVLEDAHWIDPSTLEFMRFLQERLAAMRLLILIAARPEFKPDWTHPQLLQINLDRLSRRDCVAMVDRLTGGKPLPAIVLEQIVAKTDGIPLFVEELTKTVLESHILRGAGDRYELIGPDQAIAIPDTLQGSLSARLDRLEPDAKELAQIGAAIGREFGRDLLIAVAGRQSEKMAAALASLVTAEIVQPAPGSLQSGGAYMFRHALIQEAAYQSLLLTRRRQYHAAIADALEHRFPEIVETQPEVVAQHLTSAHLPDRAIDYWTRAGERAAARMTFEEASAHAQRGLELVRGLRGEDSLPARRALPLLLVLGKVAAWTDGREATNIFREAAGIARVERLSTELSKAALGFEEAELSIGASSEASVALLEEALTAVGSEETIDRCRVLSRLGRALQSIGEFERASEATRQAMPMARRLNDQPSLFDSLMCELFSNGTSPITAQQFDGRREKLQEVDCIAESLGDFTAIAHAHSRWLPLYLEMGDINAFEDVLRRFGQLSVESHLLKWVSTSARAMRAILYGDFKLAERNAGQALDVAQDIRGEYPVGVYGMQMFTIRREQGRLAEVAPLLKRFVDENPGDAVWRPGLMLIASDLGFEAQARKTLVEMTSSGLALPMDGRRALTLSYLAEVCVRLGDVPRAEQLYDLLLPYRDIAVTVPIVTLCCGSAARYLGMLAGALERWDAAKEHFETALAMDERMKALPWLAHTQHQFARTLIARAQGADFARAKELRAAASATAERLGMEALLRRVRAGRTAG